MVMTMQGTVRPNRTSIMHMGDAYNKRKIEREALRQAIQDYHGSVPLQYWYDSLRETDDGRFSNIDMQGDRTSRLAHRQKMLKRKQMLRTKIVNSMGLLPMGSSPIEDNHVQEIETAAATANNTNAGTKTASGLRGRRNSRPSTKGANRDDDLLSTKTGNLGYKPSTAGTVNSQPQQPE